MLLQFIGNLVCVGIHSTAHFFHTQKLDSPIIVLLSCVSHSITIWVVHVFWLSILIHSLGMSMVVLNISTHPSFTTTNQMALIEHNGARCSGVLPHLPRHMCSVI